MIAPSSLPPQQTLSLYTHIPFCTVKCDYCDFYSLSGVTPARMEQTVSALIRDLRTLLPEALAAGGTVPTLYIGGGTPSVLPEKTLERLLSAIAGLIPNAPDEWTVELNPETITERTLEILRDGGVNRVSLGVQSLSDEGLHHLGRAATARGTRRALELLEKRWRGRWNGDLIVGFQGDSAARVARDVARLTDLGALHLSVYALTVEEETPLATAVESGSVTLPEDDELLELLDVARETLLQRGLERYEVSNYAVPGEESLHNLRYWRMEPYLGVGPAAASTLFRRGLRPRALRLEGVRSLERYLQPSGERYTAEELSPEELLEEHLLMGLRTAEGVSLQRLDERFGLSTEEVVAAIGAQRDGQGTEPLLELVQEPRGALRVPPAKWNLLDQGVLAAVERLAPLLGSSY